MNAEHVRLETRYALLQDQQVAVHKEQGMSAKWWKLQEQIEDARLDLRYGGPQ